MQCPNCGREAEPGAAFCAACGTALGASAAQPAPPAPQPASLPGPAATQPMPVVPPAAPEAPATYAPAAGYPPTTPQPAPAKKSKGGCLVAFLLVGLLACGGLAAAGWFGYRWYVVNVATPQVATSTVTPAQTGFATAEEALRDTMRSRGIGDWVFKIDVQTADSVSYVVGPPQSEFTDRLVFKRDANGQWSFDRAEPFGEGEGGPPPGADPALEAEAMKIVNDFHALVASNQGLAAQRLTVEPFHSDSASAEMGAGYLLGWDITGTPEVQADGSVRVKVVERRKGGSESLIFILVPTKSGLRISQVEPGR